MEEKLSLQNRDEALDKRYLCFRGESLYARPKLRGRERETDVFKAGAETIWGRLISVKLQQVTSGTSLLKKAKRAFADGIEKKMIALNHLAVFFGTQFSF